MSRESVFQAKLIERLYAMFPGCLVLKNDPDYLQGILDLTVLHGPHWVALEVKASATSKVQPNQEYYVDMLDRMSYAAFIHPDNVEEVLLEVQRALTPGRFARVS